MSLLLFLSLRLKELRREKERKKEFHSESDSLSAGRSLSPRKLSSSLRISAFVSLPLSLARGLLLNVYSLKYITNA